MKIPKIDRWLMFFGGVLIAFLVIFSRVDLDPKPLAILDQHPVDTTQLTGEFDSSATTGTYLGQTVESTPVSTNQVDLNEADARIAQQPLPPTGSGPEVLGVNDGLKRIYVDLTNQRVYAFDGDQLAYNFLISSGKWGRTPTGIFEIWGKFKYTKMSGGSRALGTYYYLPNVPFVMFFANKEIAAARGFSLHGTYWHENFGTPMSHGCINMKTEEAEKLFYWSMPTVEDKNYTRANPDNPGTQVIIYGEAPAS